MLLDADGTLLPSEEPAFEASAEVTGAFAERFPQMGDPSPDHLRRTITGKDFRTTAQDLLTHQGVTCGPEELEQWVGPETTDISAHIDRVLRPRPDVPAACFTATGLDELLPEDVRFSAEDSVPLPTSKPDPAVYEPALRDLGIAPSPALSVEDSVTGAESAIKAGIATTGLVQFVPVAGRAEALRATRVTGVVGSWKELVDESIDDREAVRT
ncbi:hypothetical protein DV20_41285 [Amycolatopsis rifamycinica]|uniref:Haloacid dehalogenase n=1 Tax=Amycolatopsis rifamycinica TaxID=287986 RepID=A0A066TSC9_9PSEU|nr:hypothetical protein DV20_41285 [Amycolatopsis rifamycinica]